MQPADTLAHEALDLLVSAGGSWTIGLSSTMPTLSSGTVTGVTDITDVPHGTISRSGASWDAPTSRSIIPTADVTLGTATGDCTPIAWVLYQSGTPVWAARVVDINVISGSPVVLPREAIRLTIPV